MTISARDDSRPSSGAEPLPPAASPKENYPSRLRLLLGDQFNLEELRTLCHDLSVEYDDLGGEGLTNKCRELIRYMARRGRIPDLLALCAELRPGDHWAELISAVQANPNLFAAAGREDNFSQNVGAGLTALANLMTIREVRTAVISFHTDFQAATGQLETLADYKSLHDLLHTLQYHCFNPLMQEAPRFPGDIQAVDNVADYELTLQRLVNDVREVAARPSLSTAEQSWIADLAAARETLREAVASEDAAPLKRAIWQLNRILAVQPAQINTRLNMAARNLRLPDLVTALTQLSDHLEGLEANKAQVQTFELGLDALTEVSEQLYALVGEHDKWQAVDMELRRIEGSMAHDLIEMEMSWPYLKKMTEPFYNGRLDDWAASFAEYAALLDSAVKGSNPNQIRRYFRRYRRQAGERFFQVDIMLKRLCEDLKQVGQPLAAVLRMIE